jgi:hypothetical protein
MHTCNYCSKSFKKESTLAVHMCEQKRRHMQKNEKHVQLGFRSYQLFYKIGTNAKKDKTYEDFAKSQYYISFCKFGYYCRDIGIDDVPGYTTWLVKNGTRLDNWGKDKQFTKWMKERLKNESVDRGVERTILFLQSWAEENNTEYNNYFNNVAPSLAVFHICSGKISPWILFTSIPAQALIDRMNAEQLKMITDYLDVDYWQRTMSVNPQDSKWVTGILEQAGI